MAYPRGCKSEKWHDPGAADRGARPAPVTRTGAPSVVEPLVQPGDLFAVAVEQQGRARSSVPSTRSVAWLQRGWGTSGLTFAQKPYSDACIASQKVFGRSSVKVKRTIDFDRLEAVLPRHGEAQRRADLVRQRLAVDARHEEGEIVRRLGASSGPSI